MELTAARLFTIEKTIRVCAERLRLDAEDRLQSDSPDVRASATLLLQRADDIDKGCDLIAGMQGCDLAVLLPMLRKGWEAERAPFLEIKAAASAAKAEVVAA